MTTTGPGSFQPDGWRSWEPNEDVQGGVGHPGSGAPSFTYPAQVQYPVQTPHQTPYEHPYTGPQPWPYAYPPQPLQRGTNGFAIASLVLAVLGMGLLAVIFGHVARSQIRTTGEGGDGLAIAGLIIGYIALGAIAALLLLMLLPFFGLLLLI